MPVPKDGDRKFIKPVDRKCLGKLGVYQPENDGYQVAAFYKGMYIAVFAIHDYADHYCVVPEGDESIFAPFCNNNHELIGIIVNLAAPISLLKSDGDEGECSCVCF